jgi:hypothetical protein
MTSPIHSRNKLPRRPRQIHSSASQLRRHVARHPRGNPRGRTFRSFEPCASPGLRVHAVPPVTSVVILPIGSQEMKIILQPCAPGNDMLLAYTALQCQVYGQHGVQRAQRVSDACMRSCTHLILARYPDGTLAGGLRLHARSHGPLPVEAALPRSRRLAALLDRLGEPTELSGMVVVPEARKTGLSAWIARAGVAAIPLLRGRAAVGFGHQHVLPLYASVGFVPRRHLGCHRYPDARYLSRVAVLEDAVALPGVSDHERSQILDLRQRMVAAQTEPMPQAGAIP